MGEFLKAVGVCVVLGLTIFVIAVFRGTQAQGDSLGTAAIGSGVIAAAVTCVAIGYTTALWLRGRRERQDDDA